MAGQVFVNGQLLDKPGTPVREASTIEVRGRRRYASRGGYKLAAALDHFRLPVTGRVALDCGASAGGFTDCLLQRGAAKVYAIDVGFGQLSGRLRLDPRVCNMERTNLSAPGLALLDPRPSLITLDLSYLSLTDALPQAVKLLAPAGDILALFKPLFEVDDAGARRTGHIQDSSSVVSAFLRVLEVGSRVGLRPIGAAKLALRPRNGVSEYFLQFSASTDKEAWQYDERSLAGLIAGPGVGNENEDLV